MNVSLNAQKDHAVIKVNDVIIVINDKDELVVRSSRPIVVSGDIKMKDELSEKVSEKKLLPLPEIVRRIFK